jgi:thermitase
MGSSSGVPLRQLLGRAAGEKMNKRVTIMKTCSSRSKLAIGTLPFAPLSARARSLVIGHCSLAAGPWFVVQRTFVVILVLVATLISALHAAPADTVPGRILVKPRDGINETDLQQLFAAHGAQQHSAIQQINVRILEVPEAAQEHVLEALQHHASIEFAEPDYIAEPETIPNDPKYSSEWHLGKIQCPQAWDVSTGSSSVIIAVLDTGVDGAHPDLTGKLVPGWNFYDNNSDTSDVYGHGTLVAGTVAAANNNSSGIASVAWNCLIMPIRISSPTGSGSMSLMGQGLTWAADHGARVANISYKVSTDATVTTAAQYFQSKGGIVTVSAGNEGDFITAGDNPYVLTISATDTTDAIASWSTTGNNVDLSAPGVSILTTVSGGTYGWAGGTSLSAPIVAGVAALVISVNPGLTGAQVQDILKDSVDDLGAPGWDPIYGRGRVNAYKAVLAAAGGTPPPTDTTPPATTITSPSSGSTASGTVTIGVSASDNVGVARVEVYINGVLVGSSTSANAALSWNTTSYANGSYTLQAKAYDVAGNIGVSAMESVSVQNTVADTTAPGITITAPATGSTVSSTVSVNVSATDNVGVTKVEWYLNGSLVGSSASASASFSWNTTAYANGSYTLQAKAYDAAGNVGSSAGVSISVQNAVPDATAPTATITAPAGGSTVSGVVSVNVSTTDNVGVTKVEWYLNGALVGSSASSSASFSWNTATSPNGSCTVQAKAYDAAGNIGSSPTINVSVLNTADAIAPVVQITSPANGSKVVRSTKVYVSASDNVSVTRVDLVVDGKTYSTSTSANPVFSWNTSKISTGSHTLQAVAYDAAGNYTRSTVVTVYK